MPKKPIGCDVVTGYYEQDGYKIHYEKVGHGDHIVCIFPSGIGHARSDYTLQFESFDKDKFTLIGWDSPGFGHSRPPERDYELHGNNESFYEYDAQTAVNLMNYLGYDSFSLMGWYDGARTALLVAILFPAKVKKLVIWETYAYLTQKIIEFLSEKCDPATWNQFEIERYVGLYGDMRTLKKVWSTHLNFVTIQGDIFGDKLRQIKCPTLALHGEHDHLVPRQSFEYLVKNIPDVKTHIFQDGKHYLHFTHSIKFNHLTQHFFLN